MVSEGNSWNGSAQILPPGKSFSPGFKKNGCLASSPGSVRSGSYIHACHLVAVLDQPCCQVSFFWLTVAFKPIFFGIWHLIAQYLPTHSPYLIGKSTCYLFPGIYNLSFFIDDCISLSSPENRIYIYIYISISLSISVSVSMFISSIYMHRGIG